MPGRRTVSIAIVVILAVSGLAGIAATDLEKKGSGGAGCLVPPAPCLFNIVGEIYVGTDAGGGMMNITVCNRANFPFTNVTVIGITPFVGGLAVFTPFTTGGRVVSASNQLEIGMYSSGYYQFASGGTSATPYSVTVRATMSNGQTITETTKIVSDS